MSLKCITFEKPCNSTAHVEIQVLAIYTGNMEKEQLKM
jgi:hypothetical protein